MSNCFLCARSPANNPLDLPKSFTARSLAANPLGATLCDRCYGAIAGEEKQMYYFSPNKQAWSKLWGRSLSRLYQGDSLLCPTIEGKREGLPVVSNLATRDAMREWILNPPDPPFTIALSMSGQKHVLPFAREGLDRDRFPVQLETESIWVVRSEFVRILEVFDNLRQMGFSKGEIESGEYRSDRVVEALQNDAEVFYIAEKIVANCRGSALFNLIVFVS